MTRTYNVLMFGNILVDSSMLSEGIYETDKPYLYRDDETIKTLIEKAVAIRNAGVLSDGIDSYIKNLIQCAMHRVELRILP